MLLQGQNLKRFSFFWQFFQKFLPLELSSQGNVKVFSRKNMDNTQNAKVFSSEKYLDWEYAGNFDSLKEILLI